MKFLSSCQKIPDDSSTGNVRRLDGSSINWADSVRFCYAGNAMRKLIWVLGIASLLLGSTATARVEHSLSYTKTQSFNSALRFLRVDNGYTIVEKDLDSGYLMFEYPTTGSSETTSGSIEVIERGSEVAIVIQLPKMPHYHEQMLASGLLKKLRADYGAPPKAKQPAKKPEAKPEKPQDDKDERPPGPPIQKAP